MDWRIVVGLITSFTILSLQTVSSELSSEYANSSEVSETKVLARRKRFLLFPDGSSLQLVFCVQSAAVIPIGDIFLYGNTAALAWSLPKDPEFLLMFKDELKNARRRQDLNEIYYLDENGRVLAKMPYKRKPIVYPVFAKRSADDMTFKEKLKLKIDRRKMHKKQEYREYLNQDHMNEKSVRFHRSSRVGLYEKVERLINALGRDGEQCVLYKLCEAKRGFTHQGTFLQELGRIIFTLPKGPAFDNEKHKEYDKAHHYSINEECSRLYPGCEDIELSDQLL